MLLLLHHEAISVDISHGKNVTVKYSYLDFAEVFDKADHSILIPKLRVLRIRGEFGVLVQSFLTNRSQKVIVKAAVYPLLCQKWWSSRINAWSSSFL